MLRWNEWHFRRACPSMEVRSATNSSGFSSSGQPEVEMDEPVGEAGGSRPDTVASRCAVRREQLGLTKGEVARRAGMSVAYLNRLETLSDDFDPAALMRLASVLGMSYEALRQGRYDAAPGQREALSHPQLARLSEDECWQRLGMHGVGRIAVGGDEAPAVLPVNFLVDGLSVVYRTEPDSALAVADRGALSFEADHIEESEGWGWSVLVTGTARRITDESTVASLAARAGATPWAGGRRDLWIRVCPDRVTGRIIRTPGVAG
ncbi:pyridoxamine 5'-phosphate oxidase family protein [Streptomyces albus]|uniref:pyridoxamine 5'-phosphate oxidase family protein n=1 Tax=Streptomyces albus TaxID=1888 RepID=UPI0034527327